MPVAMPCKTPINSGGETYGSIGKSRTKHACIVAADESKRFGMEGAPRRFHEDHIAGKGTNSLSHYNLVHKFIPVPQAMKIPDAKAAVEKKNGKTRENTDMEADESQKQNGSNCRSKERRQECGKI